VEFYIKIGKAFASSYPNHCFAWLFNYLSLSRISSLAWCLILILVICFFAVKMILDLCVKYHREINNFKYLLSLDNWYFIMWYIVWSSFYWLFLLITLSLAKECICFKSPLSSLTLVIPFDFVELVLCYS
jgi:hypothetical protein